MKVRAFITHKPSESYSDCEDRLAVNSSKNTLAISDGISQSIFSADWADLLSSFYVKNGHCDGKDRLFLCSEWERKVRDKLAELKMQGKNTRMAERMLEMKKGAGATICGVKFIGPNQWEVDVLGDSCAILVSKKDSSYDLKIFSSEDKDFDNCPDYYDSIPEKSGKGIMKKISGRIDRDNFLLLVTDPFSNYLKSHKSNCTPLIKELLELNNHNDFVSLVQRWRQNGMHDDDSTLCIVEWDQCDSMQIVHKDDIAELIQSENLAAAHPQNSTPPAVERNNEQKPSIVSQSSNNFVGHRLIEIMSCLINFFKRK